MILLLNYLHLYFDNLTFECDEESGFVTLNQEFSEIKTFSDKYVSDMISDSKNISVIKLLETDCEGMSRDNPTLFGATSDLVRDANGIISRVEGIQYLNIKKLGLVCGNDDESIKYPGRIIMHEFSEGFEGCLLARELNRKLKVSNDDYYFAHNRANSHFWGEFGPGNNGKFKMKSQKIPALY